MRRAFLLLLFVLPSFVAPLFSQVDIGVSKSYDQNFNSTFERQAGFYEWIDNSLLPGWYAHTTKQGEPLDSPFYRSTNAKGTHPEQDREAPPICVLALREGGNEKDAALGILTRGHLSAVFGVCFTNKTGKVITALDVHFVGEQWAHNTGGANTLNFEYSLDADSLSTGTWQIVEALNFTALHTQGTDDNSLNGHADENRKELSATIPGLSIPPDATFWFRWSDPVGPSSGHAQILGIDDFSLTVSTQK